MTRAPRTDNGKVRNVDGCGVGHAVIAEDPEEARTAGRR